MDCRSPDLYARPSQAQFNQTRKMEAIGWRAWWLDIHDLS